MAVRDFLGIVGALTFALPTAGWADMISDEDMAPYEVCALCHGLDGLSAMDKFPRLAGQKPEYILKQINDFRDGRRHNDGGQMSDIVSELAPEEERVVAEWFSTQPHPIPTEISSNESDGAKLFEANGCGECHGPTPPDGLTAPHVAAQHEAYLAKQLTEFRDGARDNDPEMVMRTRAADLSDEDIAALSAYLAGLPRE